MEAVFITFETAFKKGLILAKYSVRSMKKKYTNSCFYFNNEILHFTYSEVLLLFWFTYLEMFVD